MGCLFCLPFHVQRTTRRAPVVFYGGIRRHATRARATETVESVSLNPLQAPSAYPSANRRPPPPTRWGGTRTRKGPQMPSPRLLAAPPSKEWTGRSHSVPLTLTLRDRLRD